MGLRLHGHTRTRGRKSNPIPQEEYEKSAAKLEVAAVEMQREIEHLSGA